MGFVVRSCLPKITCHPSADMFIPLDDLLGGWTSPPRDTLNPKRVTVMDVFPSSP
jgi:hypothetical protein